VRIHDYGTWGDLPYFAMEFCPGGTLARKLAGKPLPPREAAQLVEQLARAMQAAHDRGIIHRDLKPGNVFLTLDGSPKVGDFGLARRMEHSVSLTQTGAVLGTPSYMAPEQALAAKDVGRAADVWSLGALLYECLGGRPPFLAATSHETVQQVIHEEPVALGQLNPTVPRDLETICHKCLQKEPGKRYAAAELLADDLGRFLRREPITARAVGLTERAWRWC
jgi:serine/threonine-protein kinase